MAKIKPDTSPAPQPAVLCPVCGEGWDITEFRPTTTHCDADTFPPGPVQNRMILYWCPCGCCWAPEDAGQDGNLSWRRPQVVFDQRPTDGGRGDLVNSLRFALKNLVEVAQPLADQHGLVSSMPHAAERARAALIAAGEDPDGPCLCRPKWEPLTW